MKQNNRYVIDKRIYEKHIDDKVHLYGMLHQLGTLAARVQDAQGISNLMDTARCYGEAADRLFDTWNIPGSYLVFGKKGDLAALKENELERLSSVLAEHDAETLAAALEQASWNLPYLIHGSSFRLLVGSLFELLARCRSMERRITGIHSETELARLQKNLAGSEKTIRRLCRSWGVPKEQDVTAHDVLERAIMEKHLIPIRLDAESKTGEMGWLDDLTDDYDEESYE